VHQPAQSRLVRRAGALLCATLLPAVAAAQIVNPAEAQKAPKPDPTSTFDEDLQDYPGRLRSWELPATIVEGARPSSLSEEDRIGDYKQPRWTARRRFPATRVYVVPAGKFEVEHWTRVKVPKDKGKSTVEHQYEAEFGLPGRWQIDIYAVTEKAGSEGETAWSEQKFEVRYAFADWGELWGNPTAYVEWVEKSASADVIEAKLLFGGELAEGWHWGTNLVLEHEVSGELENTWEITAGVSKTIRDNKFSVGAELKGALVDVHSDRGNYDEELEIGPSIQWRPLPAMHVDVAPLFGVTSDSRAADIYMVIGWEV